LVGDKVNSFIFGLLFAVVLFVVVGVVFYVGYRLGNKYKQPSQSTTEDEQKEINRLKSIQQDFVKLMNYDVSTALTRKKV
jgi:CHASE3 domain sensor protein